MPRRMVSYQEPVSTLTHMVQYELPDRCSPPPWSQRHNFHFKRTSMKTAGVSKKHDISVGYVSTTWCVLDGGGVVEQNSRGSLHPHQPFLELPEILSGACVHRETFRNESNSFIGRNSEHLPSSTISSIHMTHGNKMKHLGNCLEASVGIGTDGRRRPERARG